MPEIPLQNSSSIQTKKKKDLALTVMCAKFWIATYPLNFKPSFFGKHQKDKFCQVLSLSLLLKSLFIKKLLLNSISFKIKKRYSKELSFHRLKSQRFTTLGFKEIRVGTQHLWIKLSFFVQGKV